MKIKLFAGLQQIFLLFFGIQPQEFKVVQLFFFYITILCTGYTVNSTAAITLFLSKLSQDKLHQFLPWIYICNAIAIFLVANNYRKLIDKFSRIKLISWTTVFFILSFIIIRFLLGFLHQLAWLYFFLMVWDETCAVVLIMVFYSYLGDYFYPENAKRLYGYISGGMALGAPIGGFGSVELLHFITPSNLLIVSSAILMISNVIAYIIWKIATPPARMGFQSENRLPVSLKELFANPYLQAIFIVGIAASICTAIEVYQLFYVASQTLNEEAIGSFMGKLFGYIGIAQLLIDFILARWLFKYLGVLNVFLIIPVIFLLLSFGFFVYPILFFAAGMKFIDAGLTGTLGNMATQILLLPLPERIRMHSLAVLTGFMGTIARIMGGIILVIFSFFFIPIRYYSIVIFIAAIVWIFYVMKLIPINKKGEYNNGEFKK